MGGLEVSVLGPLAVTVDGAPITVAGPKQRSVLAMLALHANQVVPLSMLIEAVWGERAPDGAEHTLQQHVSSIRKLLGGGREAAAAGEPPQPALVTRSPGYELRVDSLDATAFTAAAATGREAASAGRWSDALAAFDAALAFWRGTALADARDTPRLAAAATRLDEQRLSTLEMHYEASLACGHAREVVAELEMLVGEWPLREGLWSHLMLALYRSGRQADALAAYQAARTVLIDELGIEPGAELRDLEQAILQQSPTLDLVTQTHAAPVVDVGATFRHDPSIRLDHIELPDGQLVLLVGDTALIGRDPSALVRLVDSRVSRRHAEIHTAAGRAELRDLGSTNGTLVNGEAVEGRRVLGDGDVISVGGFELRFRTNADVG